MGGPIELKKSIGEKLIYWKVEKLKSELIQHGLSQQLLFIYILISACAYQIFSEVGNLYSQQTSDPHQFSQSVAGLIIIVAGTCLCYYSNGGKSGRQFAERYFSLGLVVSIRFLVFLIPLLLVPAIAWGVYKGLTGAVEHAALHEIPADVLGVVWSMAFYWRLSVHIGHVAKATG
jgi:hypothetical protein